jgi:cytosine/adenosine deaminase-related metal-dependent hydrolase
MFGFRRPVSLVNGRVMTPNGTASSLRWASTVLGIDEPPRHGDEVMDLDGAFVLPGFINAHDHLELNHYGPLKGRARYENASEWIDDMRPALKSAGDIRRNSALPLGDRLFIGGLKNLLAGATTVAHHNPVYREINAHFPVRVVRRFGWAHSLNLEREPVGANGEVGGDVRDRCAATPGDAPFILHAAEGTDRAAADEVARLLALGCLRQNTVLVHGVAIDRRAWHALLASRASLVWCPASNAFLFGHTAPVREFLDAAPDAWAHICLGTDSRITGARDLLDELRQARAAAAVTPRELLRMVTSAAAGILRLRRAGHLAVNAPADVVVVPPIAGDAADAVLAARRSHLRLVTIGGRPMLAAPEFAEVFRARRRESRAIRIDGVERLADAPVARRIERCSIHEPGIECIHQ